MSRFSLLRPHPPAKHKTTLYFHSKSFTNIQVGLGFFLMMFSNQGFLVFVMANHQKILFHVGEIFLLQNFGYLTLRLTGGVNDWLPLKTEDGEPYWHFQIVILQCFYLFTQRATKLRKHLCILSNFQYVAIIGQTDWEKLEMLQGNSFKIWSPSVFNRKALKRPKKQQSIYIF